MGLLQSQQSELQKETVKSKFILNNYFGWDGKANTNQQVVTVKDQWLMGKRENWEKRMIPQWSSWDLYRTGCVHNGQKAGGDIVTGLIQGDFSQINYMNLHNTPVSQVTIIRLYEAPCKCFFYFFYFAAIINCIIVTKYQFNPNCN